jgi:superfamily II DNA or RNA helicase
MSTLHPGTLVLARGRSWLVQARVPYQDCAALHLRSADADLRGRTLLVPFDRVEPLPPTRSAAVVSVRRWRREVLRGIVAARPFGSVAGAADAHIDVLPFQLEPALAMRRHGRTRILLADDVGLGKTIQAGLIVAEIVREHVAARVLIFSPAGLRDQWRQELHERFGTEVVTADALWLADSTRRLPADVNPWALPGVYVTSFDLVKRPEVLRSLEDVTWDLAIVDEAHACSSQTMRRAAVHAIASRARRVLLLTATPPDGDLQELTALRSIGELPDDVPLTEFRRARGDVQSGATPLRSTLRRVRLSPAERRMHRLLERYTSLVWTEAGARADQRARLAALVLRKRALSSGWSLGTSLRRRLELLGTPGAGAVLTQLSLPLLDEDLVEDSAPDAVIGAAGLADAARERELLMRLERVATRASGAESKVRFLIRLLRRTREPLIVFTEYRDTLQHLERACLAAGHAPLTLHGGMGPRERGEVQRAFNAAGRLLLATDAASEGLNLHHRCRAVVHFELPWTLARLRQRTGRVNRLGQVQRVHEILLVAQHTAERMVLEPLVRRALLTRRNDRRADRLVDRLTEMQVGSAVMEARPVEAASEPAHGGLSIDVRAEAIAEGDRIVVERRVRRRYRSSAEHRPRLVVSRSRRPPERFEVIAAVRLEDADGRVQHTTLAVLAVHCRLQRVPRSNADWRMLAEELSTARQEAWRSRVLALTRRDIADAIEQHRIVSTGVVARDAAMLDTQTSVARQLVQVGLFDGRALRALERQREAAATLLDEHALRERAATPTLATTIEVLAIR